VEWDIGETEKEAIVPNSSKGDVEFVKITVETGG
jgi:hypothetical protein